MMTTKMMKMVSVDVFRIVLLLSIKYVCFLINELQLDDYMMINKGLNTDHV